MAFSDESRRFWHIDLTTRAGAQSAAYQGAIACFVFCSMGVLGLLLWGGLGAGPALIAGAAGEAAVALIAGLRLRAGKGAWWGIASAVLAGLELIGKVVAISPIGIMLTGIVVVMTIQGVRGAFALANGRFADDDIDAFA